MLTFTAIQSYVQTSLVVVHMTTIYLFVFIFCIGCSAHMLAHCKPYLHTPEEDFRSPGIGITEDYKLSCGFWELNLGPLQEQTVLLTSEPSLFISYILIFLNRSVT